MTSTIARVALVAGAALAVAGCTSYGGRNGYGYGGVSYGYATPYYGYATPYYGWYDNYYYPGTGYYVYERSGSRHRWSDNERRYWESRGGNRNQGENWNGYRNHRDRDGDNDRDDNHRWRD
jgi:hypothetical protein